MLDVVIFVAYSQRQFQSKVEGFNFFKAHTKLV